MVVKPTGRLSAKLDLWETVNGTTIRNYDVDMTKRLHMIVISADFDSFQHVHPALGANGHFTIELRVPKPARYYVFADTDPHGLGKAVFRFPVVFGGVAPEQPDLRSTGKSTVAGPYLVTLNSLDLHTGTPSVLRVRISKGGSLASDLHPYLGAAGHAVFIDAKTLDYVHVHPVGGGSDGDMPAMDTPGMGTGSMEMTDLPANAKVSGAMTLHVSPVPAGSYKLWLQFRGGTGLEVAPFVLRAK